jgi:hypothetical protein
MNITAFIEKAEMTLFESNEKREVFSEEYHHTTINHFLFESNRIIRMLTEIMGNEK